jgi:putative transposase
MSRSEQKYSDQQKQMAVQHYLDHDRCIASTMRALGYPVPGATDRSGLMNCTPQVRPPHGGRAPNILHPGALKAAAVIELCTRKTSAQEIAQKLAVCRPTLYNWKNQLLGP